VLGPNPRQIYDEKAAKVGIDPWGDDPSDVDFPVRRAVLLRSLLGLVKGQENDPLEIDRGLLTALLEINHYRNGARSIEKLVSQLRDRGGLPLGRAHLPADNLLGLYVDDVAGLHSLIRRSDRFLDQAEKLAPILHEDWRQGLPKKEKGAVFDVTYEELDQEGKAANVAAAARIPEILALAGFSLEGGKASSKQETVVRRFSRLIWSSWPKLNTKVGRSRSAWKGGLTVCNETTLPGSTHCWSLMRSYPRSRRTRTGERYSTIRSMRVQPASKSYHRSRRTLCVMAGGPDLPLVLRQLLPSRTCIDWCLLTHSYGTI
jgi:hypothetical protein